MTDLKKPTRDELLQALEAIVYPAYGEKLRKLDGSSPTVRAMDLLLRERGQAPLGEPRVPREAKAPSASIRRAPSHRSLGI